MDKSEHFDVEKLVYDTVCRGAWEAGRRHGFSDGVQMAQECLGELFTDASTVRNVFRNGDHTILLFADGERERVTYRHEPGGTYDSEKAIMACMLKHLIGNGYIRVLRDFGDYVPKGAIRDTCGDCCICACRACDTYAGGDEDGSVFTPVLCDPEDEEEIQAGMLPPVDADPEDEEEIQAGLLPPVDADPDDFDSFFDGIAEEPGFGPNAFGDAFEG